MLTDPFVAVGVPAVPAGILADAYVVTSLVPELVTDSVPLTSSLAETVTAEPVFVPPLIHPVEFVTDGVTDTVWFETVPFVADGVPAVPSGIVRVS